MKRWGTALVLLAACALTACGGDGDDEQTEKPADETQTVTALDESFTIAVPEGWTTKENFLGAPVVVAVQGEDRFDQVLISHYFDEVRAEEEAISVGGMLSGSNVFCERLDESTVFGEERLVFDCPVEEAGARTTHKLFFPIVRDGEEESALVLIQTTGGSLEETADVVEPILESFTWQ